MNFLNFKSPKFRLLNLVLALFVSTTLLGCEEEDSSHSSEENIAPLTPEELGYYQEFNRLRSSTSNYAYSLLKYSSLVSLDKELNKSSDSNDNQEYLESAIDNLQDIGDDYLPVLKKVLPPSSMTDFHNSWVSMLEELDTSSSSDELLQKSKDFKKISDKFAEEFKPRARKYPNSNETDIYFKPLFLPTAINLSSFELELDLEVNTPVGEFSVASAPEESSITKLVVEHNDKIRYVSLAPGFNLHIPSSCGVNIKNPLENRLTVEVPTCKSDIASSPNNQPEEKPVDVQAETRKSYEEKPFNDSPETNESVETITSKSREKGNSIKELLVLSAKSDIEKGNYQKSLNILDSLIKNHPNDFELWFNRGVSLQRLQRYNDARISLEKAIALNPHDYFAWNNHGNSLLLQGKHYDSIVSYRKAVAIDPNKFNAIQNIGLAYQKLGKYKESLEYFDQATRLDAVKAKVNKKVALVWSNRGFTLELMGRYNEALESYDKALEIDPNLSIAIENRKKLMETVEANY